MRATLGAVQVMMQTNDELPVAIGIAQLEIPSVLASARAAITTQLRLPTTESFQFVRGGEDVPHHAEATEPLANFFSILVRRHAEALSVQSKSIPPPFVGQAALPQAPPTCKDESSAASKVAAADRIDVYFGNVPLAADATLLGELVQLAGPGELHVPQGPDGKHRGFVFGRYTDEQSARYAVAVFNGVHILGQPLKVRIATH